MILTVEDLKEHLNVSDDLPDALIEQKILAAEAFTDLWLPEPLADMDPVPDDLKEAVRLLVGHLIANREASLIGIAANMLPLGYWDIVNQHRAFGFGASAED